MGNRFNGFHEYLTAKEPHYVYSLLLAALDTSNLGNAFA